MKLLFKYFIEALDVWAGAECRLHKFSVLEIHGSQPGNDNIIQEVHVPSSVQPELG